MALGDLSRGGQFPDGRGSARTALWQPRADARGPEVVRVQKRVWALGRTEARA
jgi:hypothetical protein